MRFNAKDFGEGVKTISVLAAALGGALIALIGCDGPFGEGWYSLIMFGCILLLGSIAVGSLMGD